MRACPSASWNRTSGRSSSTSGALVGNFAVTQNGMIGSGSGVAIIRGNGLGVRQRVAGVG
jgi:hypothetical protein